MIANGENFRGFGQFTAEIGRHAALIASALSAEWFALPSIATNKAGLPPGHWDTVRVRPGPLARTTADAERRRAGRRWNGSAVGPTFLDAVYTHCIGSQYVCTL